LSLLPALAFAITLGLRILAPPQSSTRAI
jgi:hypothetical protein